MGIEERRTYNREEASWNFSELFLQAQEDIQGYFDSRQNLHSSCWCSQGQACRCPQTARLWTRPHHRTNEIEWIPHASSQPDTCWPPQTPLMSVPSRFQRPSTMSTSST